jgi:hypothetical protein
MSDSDAVAVESDEFAVIGRTFAECGHFFDFDPARLVGESVLCCPSGVRWFVAEATDRGIDAVGADVLSDTPSPRLARRARRDFHDAVRQVSEKRDLFVWDYYDDVRAHLRDAHERFLCGYDATVESVPFEFQRGATEMLRVSV